MRFRKPRSSFRRKRTGQVRRERWTSWQTSTATCGRPRVCLFSSFFHLSSVLWVQLSSFIFSFSLAMSCCLGFRKIFQVARSTEHGRVRLQVEQAVSLAKEMRAKLQETGSLEWGAVSCLTTSIGSWSAEVGAFDGQKGPCNSRPAHWPRSGWAWLLSRCTHVNDSLNARSVDAMAAAGRGHGTAQHHLMPFRCCEEETVLLKDAGGTRRNRKDMQHTQRSYVSFHIPRRDLIKKRRKRSHLQGTAPLDASISRSIGRKVSLCIFSTSHAYSRARETSWDGRTTLLHP